MGSAATRGPGRRGRRATVALGVLALLAGGCGSDDSGDGASTNTGPPATGAPATTTTTGPTTTTTVPTTTTTEPDPAARTEVRSYLLHGEHVAPVHRTVPAEAPLGAAMEATLAGPGPVDTDLGFTTAIPAGTEMHSLAVADGLATVDLSAEFTAGGGTLSMQARVAQVVFTLTQFPEVADRVTIWIDGAPVDGIGGEGIPATDVARADFASVTPAILVEQPLVGDTVSVPFEVTGTANVFEGNVVYTLTDDNDLVLDESFTTAAADDIGTWGPFSFTIDTGARGTAILEVYWISPEDGEGTDVVTIPVQLVD